MRRPLFVRGKLGASLTPAGEQFLRYAPSLVQLWERARHGVAVPEGRRAVLAVGCEHSLWDPALLRWLHWMRRTDPAVALRVHVGLAGGIVEQVAEGIIDIGIVYAPPHRAGLRVEPLAEERLVLVATPAAAGSCAGDYVQVDWGPQFGMLHATARTAAIDADLVVDFGPLGLAYILEAVHLVADQGWRLLPRYGYEPETALWRHRDGLPRPPTSLTDLDFDGDDAEPPQTAPLSELGAYLAEAKRILAEEPESGEAAPDLGPAAEGLRWFPNPAEVES